MDKIIYHYSQHCHGCKKFGGNYENFAKNKSKNHPQINFYRINNDLNKSEGVRNYNSTPIFAFYKNFCSVLNFAKLFFLKIKNLNYSLCQTNIMILSLVKFLTKLWDTFS